MQLGDHVELTEGVLKGEKATIVTDEEGNWHQNDEDDWGEEVYIQYDRKGVHCGREQGFAILNNIWTPVEILKVIN